MNLILEGFCLISGLRKAAYRGNGTTSQSGGWYMVSRNCAVADRKLKKDRLRETFRQSLNNLAGNSNSVPFLTLPVVEVL